MLLKVDMTFEPGDLVRIKKYSCLFYEKMYHRTLRQTLQSSKILYCSDVIIFLKKTDCGESCCCTLLQVMYKNSLYVVSAFTLSEVIQKYSDCYDI